MGLSNSHDNIHKQNMFGNSSHGGGGAHASPFSQYQPGGNSSSAASNASSRAHHRSGFNFAFSNSSAVPGALGPTHGSGRSQFYPNPPNSRLKEEFTKNNRTLMINGVVGL